MSTQQTLVSTAATGTQYCAGAKSLTAGASLDVWQREAGMDWSIKSAPVAYFDSDGAQRHAENQRVLYRSDSNQALSVVSDSYKVVQPAQVIQFFSDLVEEQNMHLSLAGTIKGGRRFWALATGDQSYTLGGVDVIKPHLMLATSCDGSMSTRAMPTTVRIACNNMLALVRKAKGSSVVTVRHNTEFQASSVKQQLGLGSEEIDAFMALADDTASRGVTDRAAVNYFVELYKSVDSEGEIKNESRLETVVNNLMDAYKNGPGAELSTARGTQWGLLNAVTNYVDYTAPSRSDENRFIASQFGAGLAKKEQAIELLGAVEYRTIVKPVVAAEPASSDFDRLMSATV